MFFTCVYAKDIGFPAPRPCTLSALNPSTRLGVLGLKGNSRFSRAWVSSLGFMGTGFLLGFVVHA